MENDRRTSRPYNAWWRRSLARPAPGHPVRRSSILKESSRRARCTSSGITAAYPTFPPASISRYPLVSRIQFIECSGNSAGLYAVDPPQGGAGALHGLLSCSDWTGVPLSTLLDEVGVRPTGKWLLAEGADAAAMSRSIPIEKAWDDALIAIREVDKHILTMNLGDLAGDA